MIKNDLQFEDAEIAEGGSSIILVALMLLLSIWGIVTTKHPPFRDGLSRRFTFLMVFTYLIIVAFSLVYHLGGRSMYISIILPLFLYYFMAIVVKAANLHNWVIWSMTVVAFLLSYTFVTNYNILMSELLISKANSGSYYALYLLPFMLCHKNKSVRIVSTIIILLVVMLSIKRGGFFAIIACIAAYLWISQISMKGKKLKLWGVVVIAVAVVGLWYLIVTFNFNSLEGRLYERVELIEERGGSGRLPLYAAYLNLLTNSSPLELLLGHGWWGSIRVSGLGLTCHNDFLEAIVDYGIGGLVLYIMLYVALIRHCRRMVRLKHEYAPAMGASITLFFANSMVAHILIYPWFLMSFALFWGFIIASTGDLAFKRNKIYKRKEYILN